MGSTCPSVRLGPGPGGWPLTVIMTPDKQPFFAGTYFPKHDRQGLPGLLRILQAVSKQWKENRTVLLDQSAQIVNFLRSAESGGFAAGEKGFSGEADHPQLLIDEGFSYFSRTLIK